MNKVIFSLVLLTALLLGLTAQAAHAQNRKALIRSDRYEMTKLSSEVFSHPKYTGDKSVFEGYKRVQVKEIPEKYRKLPAWNEFGKIARVIYLGDNPEAWVYLDPGSWTLGYLEGCRTSTGGVTFNRLKWVTTPPEPEATPCVVDEPPTLIKFEDRDGKRIYYWEDKCENTWTTEVPLPPTPETPKPVTTTVTVPCPDCPEISYKGEASGREKAVGGIVGTVVKTVIAGVISYAGSSKGERGKAVLLSTTSTAAGDRVANATNPSHDKGQLKVSWPDNHTQTVEVKRNKTTALDRNGSAVWEDGVITVSFGERECATFEPRVTRNWVLVPVIIRNNGQSPDTKPIKHQDDPVVAPDERRGDRRNNGGQRALAPTDGGGQVRNNSSGSRWNRAMKPNN